MVQSSLAAFVRKLRDPRVSSSIRAEEFRLHRGAIDEFLARELARQAAVPRRAGSERRRQLRIRRCLAVDLSAGTCGRSMTLDVGMGGFCTLLASPPPVAGSFPARLHLHDRESILAEVVVVDVSRRPGARRVSFHFTGLSDADRGRLQLLMLELLIPSQPASPVNLAAP